MLRHAAVVTPKSRRKRRVGSSKCAIWADDFEHGHRPMTSVSVVIPSYNHAAYVAEAIRSALDQSLGDLEVVVTDDGSRDGTPDVIRRIGDPRIDLEVFEQ